MSDGKILYGYSPGRKSINTRQNLPGIYADPDMEFLPGRKSVTFIFHISLFPYLLFLVSTVQLPNHISPYAVF